jgi:hypothetical protein
MTQNIQYAQTVFLNATTKTQQQKRDNAATQHCHVVTIDRLEQDNNQPTHDFYH